ncbi:hypothetical protein ABIA32_005553 [Streptacidiphilus sp. MAP12-20]|uniref:hypothetical protein n=1 Tax=Streptacidiphilus sp. MAP12-20 TaxID=3156299 RepID=UPI003512460D
MTIQRWRRGCGGGRGRGLALAGAAGALAALVVVGMPTSAAASCAAASPSPSPFRFVGMVMAIEDGGRVALVSHQGVSGLVEVDGSPAARTQSHTSVDRTYVLYATYEFDPYNATAPYHDDICTATRMIGPPKATGGMPMPTATSQSGPPWGWIGGGIGVGAVVLVGGTAFTLRRRQHQRQAGPA